MSPFSSSPPEGITAGLQFPALLGETRHAVGTACAAWHLGRKEQTLRGWACHEDGPLRPLRIHGRLAWPVAELQRVLGMVTQ
jgi:hypothetical protein